MRCAGGVGAIANGSGVVVTAGATWSRAAGAAAEGATTGGTTEGRGAAMGATGAAAAGGALTFSRGPSCGGKRDGTAGEPKGTTRGGSAFGGSGFAGSAFGGSEPVTRGSGIGPGGTLTTRAGASAWDTDEPVFCSDAVGAGAGPDWGRGARNGAAGADDAAAGADDAAAGADDA
jgi:hypothetical protein